MKVCDYLKTRAWGFGRKDFKLHLRVVCSFVFRLLACVHGARAALAQRQKQAILHREAADWPATAARLFAEYQNEERYARNFD